MLEVAAYTTRYGGPVIVPTCEGETSLVLTGPFQALSP